MLAKNLLTIRAEVQCLPGPGDTTEVVPFHKAIYADSSTQR